jgi:hypothetical protein
MGRISSPLRVYWAVTIAAPIALLYPALVYLDLAGMGGYDGFASPRMMELYGIGASTASHYVLIYYVFGMIYVGWLLSALNLPVALAILVCRAGRSKKPR